MCLGLRSIPGVIGEGNSSLVHLLYLRGPAVELPAGTLGISPFATKCASGCVALWYSLPIAVIVLVLVVLPIEVVLTAEVILGTVMSASIVEVALAVSIHLLVLTDLIVSIIVYHLPASALCNVVAIFLAKNAELASVGWR